MHLILPSVLYKSNYLEALNEAKYEHQETQLNKPALHQSFDEFVRVLISQAEGKNLLPGHVPSSMFWLIDHDEFIGRVQIRHYLNQELLMYGGHIGYYIRPSKRGCGYGTQILKLGLNQARLLGLNKVLITCDEDNSASRKIILKNNGMLENSLPRPLHPPKLRFWVQLTKSLN